MKKRIKILKKCRFVLPDYSYYEFEPGYVEIDEEIANNWFIAAHCDPDYVGSLQGMPDPIAKTGAVSAPVQSAKVLHVPKQTIEIASPKTMAQMIAGEQKRKTRAVRARKAA